MSLQFPLLTQKQNCHYFDIVFLEFSCNFLHQTIIIKISKMNRQVSANSCPITESRILYKVNEIVNSIYAMNNPTLESHVYNCARIVGQLLHNDLIAHMTSMKAVKMLVYELVMLVVEQSAVQRPRLTMMENNFGHNKRNQVQALLKNNLTSIDQMLGELVWSASSGKKKVSQARKNEQNASLQEKYKQFQYLLQDFQKYMSSDLQPGYEQDIRKRKRTMGEAKILEKNQKEHQEELEQNEALIQQLEEIVCRKQKRIKQLTAEIQQGFSQQKQLEDLMNEIQSRNMDLNQEVQILNEKLAEQYTCEKELREKIDILQKKEAIQEKHMNTLKKNSVKTEHTIKSKFSLDDLEEDKKDFKEFFEVSSPFCEECLRRKEQDHENQGFHRILYTQALTIEALM